MDGCNQGSAAAEVADGVSLDQRVAAGRGRKARSDCKVSDLEIYVAIVTHMGIIKSVALALGIVRSTLYRRIERAPQLKACFDAARAVMVHYAWEQFDEAVKAKARWAIIFGVSRMHGVPMSPAWPSASGSAASSAASSAAAAAKKKATELVPQPDVADAWTLRLVLGVENGEPWAIKYCLSHLDPNGPCGINQVRGRKDDAEEEDSADELEEELDEEQQELQKEIDAEDAHDYEVASGHVQQQHGILTGRIKLRPVPPIVAESLRDSNSAPDPDANAFRVMTEAAPPVVKVEPLATAKVAESLRDSNSSEQPNASALRMMTEEAPPLVKAEPRTDALFNPHQPADVSPRFEQLIDDHRVDEPDAKAFRLILEREARPPAAPPLVKADLHTGEHSNAAEVLQGASAGLSHEFESRSDSATLRHSAAQEQTDGIVARRSRSLTANEVGGEVDRAGKTVRESYGHKLTTNFHESYEYHE